MPLDTYAALQASILSWLARPGDPLVSPSIPDIIQLFEHEATRRLKVGGAEKRASLTALSAAVALPADFGELRLATSGGVILTYVTPMQLPGTDGPPAHYTIIGNEMRLGPSPSGGCTIEIVYQSGVPPLSDSNTTNWLLTAHPDCYLFGSLVEAESFIGSDERIPLWAQRREAAFASIETADRKARWGGAPLSIRAEGVSGGNGTAAGDWTSAPPVPIPIAGIVAGDGLTGGGTEGIVTVALDTPVAVSRGGTGATTAPAALAALGGAPLASPALSGNPTAPTPAPGDADTSIATTAFVGAALSAQALAGDVTGPTSATAVVRLQGRPVASTAPTSSQVLQWSGTTWAPATAASGASITIGDTAPASPAIGALWWDSIGGQLYLWFADGTSTQWVPASNQPGPAGATGATGATGLTGPAGSANMSGMTAGQLPVAASATSVTSSIALPLAVANGGTGSTTAVAALTALGAVAKAGDTMSGTLTVNANFSAANAYVNLLQLTPSGVTGPTLDIYASQFTALHSPDGSGLVGSIALGLAANPDNWHANARHLFQNRAATVAWAVFSTTGTANVSGAWAVISDPAAKETAVEPYTRGLDAILALEPVTFRYSAGTPFAPEDEPSRPLMGLMADQVRPHIPEICTTVEFPSRKMVEDPSPDSVPLPPKVFDAIEPGNLIYALINAVKELSAKVAALEGKPA